MSRARKRRARTDRSSRQRIAVLAAFLLSLFVVAALRAAHLQVREADTLRERAERQRRRHLSLLPERGSIYDRNDRELAASIPGTSVFVDPTSLDRQSRDLERVCQVLGLNPAQTRKRLAEGGERFAWLQRHITPDQAERLRAMGITAVGLAREPHRYYPKKALAGQVLGFVGVDGDGLGGLEYRFDDLLRGSSRKVWAERDARGELLLAQIPDAAAVQGHNLVLTLDETIQHIAEEELAAAVTRSQARGGLAVVMEPASGEILALAQVPLFNPNAVAESRAVDRKISAVVDVYEPGSTFKALFVGILLDRKVSQPSELVFCENGKWRVHGRTIHDHHPHGWLSVAKILEVSSNIGVAKLSEKVSPQVLYDGLRDFGLGSELDIELGGESGGILPPPKQWSKMTPKTAVYGQGISATALQVTTAFAAIANGGVRMSPRLVRAVIDDAGTPVQTFESRVAGQALSPATASTLTRLLEQVVYGEEGTAPEAAVPGYTVAGKTGTSWKPDPERGGYLRHKVVASFAGYVPSRQPRLAILVAVDEPTKGLRYGGTVAAPAFREIARHSLAYLNVPADTRPEPVAAAEAPSHRPQRAGAQAVTGQMPDLQGLTMREVLRKMDRTGWERPPILLGTGIAASQDPAPGTPLRRDQAWRVVFRPLM